MGTANRQQLREYPAKEQQQQSAAGSAQDSADHGGRKDLLFIVPQQTYCSRCECYQSLFTLTQILYQDPQKFISYRVHLVLECGHSPASPYDRWEECVTISCDSTKRLPPHATEVLRSCPLSRPTAI